MAHIKFILAKFLIEIMFSAGAYWIKNWHIRKSPYFLPLSLDVCGLECIFLIVLLNSTAAINKKQSTTKAVIAQN